MKCPKCETEDTKVLRTINVAATRVNERECVACKHRFTTVAQIVDDPNAYQAAKKIRDNGGIYPVRVTPNKIGG